MGTVPTSSVFKKTPFTSMSPQDVASVEDITAVITLRAHDGNPWVIERLRLLDSYYEPKPHVLVLDFGSGEQHAGEVKRVCEELGFEYHYEDDADVYSPAAAHNRGFEKSSTDLILFCDVDCFGERDFFSHLARVATILKMKSVIDATLVLPVYHVGEADSAAITSSGNPATISDALSAFGHYSTYAHFKREDNFFIAPYSNIFLVNRHFFSLTGGYDENFRGHGSEDFEYLTRMGIHTGLVPTPKNLTDDKYGPLKSEFSDVKPYIGFRRLLEVMSYPAESFGLKIFHIWHPRPEAVTWLASNDWKRERMAEAFSKYVSDHPQLLNVDFIRREKTMLCLCKHVDQWGYFLPFRAAGYKLIPLFSDSKDELQSAIGMISRGEIDAVSIFNPHMKSHASFKFLLMAARDQGVEVVVIERGALPETIYYADEVSYTSDSFSENAYLDAVFTDEELSKANTYVQELRQGNSTLEAMSSYQQTATIPDNAALLLMKRNVIFIPLQLEEDMAVTMFLKGEQTYPDFVASLPAVIEANPDTLFVIKPHPLSKADIPLAYENVMLAKREDNIHFLIDAASGVVCYNSGVGLLSLLHGRPTATIGNAFYNMDGAGYRASSLSDAVEHVVSGEINPPSDEQVTRLAAWFTERKYSTFIAKDNIRDFGHRKSHGYTDVSVTSFRWGAYNIPMLRQKQFVDFSWKSYISARTGMRHKAAAAKPKTDVIAQSDILVTAPPRVLELTPAPAKKKDTPPISAARSQAKLAFLSKDYAKAATLYSEAVLLAPTDVGLLRESAEAHFSAGLRVKAAKLLKAAAEIKPGNKNLRQRLRYFSASPLKRVFMTSKAFNILPDEELRT